MPPGKSWKVLNFLLENFQDLESSGNLLARSWKVHADENSHDCIHQVCFLTGRYAGNAFTAGVLPRTPLAELTALSETS